MREDIHIELLPNLGFLLTQERTRARGPQRERESERGGGEEKERAESALHKREMGGGRCRTHVPHERQRPRVPSQIHNNVTIAQARLA